MSSPLRACLVVSLAALAVPAGPASAFDFVVTRYDDPVPDGCVADDCSLREAVIAANVDSGADRILLSAGTYRLTIVGTNENLAADGDLDLLWSVELIGAGPGITIIDSDGMGESSLRASGNTRIFALRRLSFRNSDVHGASLGSGTHTVEECEFSANGTLSSNSGLSTTSGSIVTVLRSTFSGNIGRGLSVTQGSATIQNSTFSGNGDFELFMNLATTFSCTHCTVADSADTDAAVRITDSLAVFANSIVAGSCTYFGTGALDSLGGNIESTGNLCSFDQGSDLTGVTAVALDLAALADNGGHTSTHLPGVDSAPDGQAIDALCLAADQRGVARSTACESGAVEIGAAPPTPIFNDGFLQGHPGAWSDAVGYVP